MAGVAIFTPQTKDGLPCYGTRDEFDDYKSQLTSNYREQCDDLTRDGKMYKGRNFRKESAIEPLWKKVHNIDSCAASSVGSDNERYFEAVLLYDFGFYFYFEVYLIYYD